MDIFLKASAGVLIAVVLCLVLAKQGKDLSALLLITVCCMVITIAMTFLQPVIDFFYKLESLGNFNPQLLTVLLKTVGIGLLAEITCLICTDAGNAAMGKSLQILGSFVIIWLSIPLFSELIALLEGILEGL